MGKHAGICTVTFLSLAAVPGLVFRVFSANLPPLAFIPNAELVHPIWSTVIHIFDWTQNQIIRSNERKRQNSYNGFQAKAFTVLEFVPIALWEKDLTKAAHGFQVTERITFIFEKIIFSFEYNEMVVRADDIIKV